ncbi:glycosyltransferase family 2 protein [Pseudochrobactrum sp. XF203]|uniref:glycosyltransferase family 2 protein n=1 Tax=Pseudochrobactrum sp. XF203 TaxID=2879116 RepID=UPI001CE3B363|nr:glycosyltransferase family 2 protein [Pseudochrobactrum sp. XF203]UCA47059.1 glycosyltransferase family 2 protein [Pseudochrobactrum sp. XF203]
MAFCDHEFRCNIDFKRIILLNFKVTILLATYNGAKFLEEQLTSFLEQTQHNIDLIVSDDGSTDETLPILQKWQKNWPKGSFKIIQGPGTGYADNFRHLILSLNDNQGYVAFSDQDDIWHTDKLAKAMEHLSQLDDDTQVMYGSRSRLVDRESKPIGYSPLFRKKPSFENALVQSIAGGNTIVLNAAAFNLVRESAQRTHFFSHDWWCYQLISGAGGTVLYDPVPSIDYRQHGNNVFGRNNGIHSIKRRLSALLNGDFSNWIDINLESLEKCQDLLLIHNINLVNEFKIARKDILINRLLFLFRNDIKRQTRVPNIILYVTALIGKL